MTDERPTDEAESRPTATRSTDSKEAEGTAQTPAVHERSTLDSAEVFSLVGDDVRLEIIAALSDSGPRAVSFSDLHEQVGLRDSGQFNYHLTKLVPHFVSKTDEGYQLTSAGRRVARAVASGFYTDSPEIAPFAVDGGCIHCGERGLEASYADEQFHIACRECERTIIRVDAPPSIVRGRTPTEALDAFERWSRTRVQLAHVDELCPACAGPIERTLTTEHDGPSEVLPRFECRVCGGTIVTSFGALATRVPAVRAFHESHDIDTQSVYYWEMDQFVTDEHVEILSTGPWRLQVSFHVDDESCRVVMDETHTVRRVTIE